MSSSRENSRELSQPDHLNQYDSKDKNQQYAWFISQHPVIAGMINEFTSHLHNFFCSYNVVSWQRNIQEFFT